MAVATKTMSTHVGSPWCWWYISTVIGLLSIALLHWSLYPCQHSLGEYCLTISFLVGRLVECHELCCVEERMDIFQGPLYMSKISSVTVVAVTLLLYHSLYPDPSLHQYVFGHFLPCYATESSKHSHLEDSQFFVYVPEAPLLSNNRLHHAKRQF